MMWKTLITRYYEKSYQGEVTTDRYGRKIPKHAHGTANIGRHTSSTRLIMAAVMELCDSILDPNLLVRRINVTANYVIDEKFVIETHAPEQLDFFADDDMKNKKQLEKEALIRERKEQKAMLAIKKKYGKNAILKGIDLQDGATTIERNTQIGGHKAYGCCNRIRY